MPLSNILDSILTLSDRLGVDWPGDGNGPWTDRSLHVGQAFSYQQVFGTMAPDESAVFKWTHFLLSHTVFLWHQLVADVKLHSETDSGIFIGFLGAECSRVWGRLRWTRSQGENLCVSQFPVPFHKLPLTFRSPLFALSSLPCCVTVLWKTATWFISK